MPGEIIKLGLDCVLTRYTALPRAWHSVLEHYPGYGRMIDFMGIHETVPQSSTPIAVEATKEGLSTGKAPSHTSLPHQVDVEIHSSEASLGD